MRGGVRMYDHEKGTEADLIRRAKRGDVKAFSGLYSEIYLDLYKFALYTTKHKQDAEDAVSEAVMTAWEKLGQLRKEESFRSWMFTILNNQCRKILKKRNQEAVLERADRERIGIRGEDGVEPDHAGIQDVRAAFETLDEEERMILAFSVFAGYQSEEIGRMLECSPGTVRSKKRRALGKLRRILENVG